MSYKKNLTMLSRASLLALMNLNAYAAEIKNIPGNLQSRILRIRTEIASQYPDVMKNGIIENSFSPFFPKSKGEISAQLNNMQEFTDWDKFHDFGNFSGDPV